MIDLNIIDVELLVYILVGLGFVELGLVVVVIVIVVRGYF